MSKIKWDATGERLYETGVNHGVLFPKTAVGGGYSVGVAWNGLTAVTESPSGAEATPLYADDIKYLNLISAEEFGATVEAYTYPDEFAVCDGSAEVAKGVLIGQQTRKQFGLVYSTRVGNDEQGNDLGYKIHIIYNCTAAPSEKAYATINDSPEAISFSWELSTTPVTMRNGKSTATIIIDSTKVNASALAAFEEIIYGKDATPGSEAVDPRLPDPDEIMDLFDVPEVVGITVATPPTKTTYSAGETLDLTGLVVKEEMSDGSEGSDVTASCTFDPVEGATLSVSDTKVTITYNTFTTEQAITVS